MFRIPFGYLPGHWGLKGKTREIAKAEYELSGADLEFRLLEIKKDELDSKSYAKKFLDLQLKYKRIDETDYHRQALSLIENGKEKELAELELDFKEGKLNEIEYNKKLATIKNEPWVTILNMDFTQGSSLEGSFELDWNQAFIDKLKKEGYNGATPDAIINQWFMELCRNIAMEEFDGTGDFTADSAANLETLKRWNSESMSDGRKGYR